MKRTTYLILGSVVFLLIASYAGVYIWIDRDVKKNISIAKERYPGTAEEALIGYLLDASNPMKKRSTTAVWTLGQIKSEKALPILNDFYNNDPKGKTCKGRHDAVICQSEVYQALRAIKSKYIPLHSRLNT